MYLTANQRTVAYRNFRCTQIHIAADFSVYYNLTSGGIKVLSYFSAYMYFISGSKHIALNITVNIDYISCQKGVILRTAAQTHAVTCIHCIFAVSARFHIVSCRKQYTVYICRTSCIIARRKRTAACVAANYTVIKHTAQSLGRHRHRRSKRQHTHQ